MGAGLDEQYVICRETGEPPDDMPDAMAEFLKETHYCLIYQEQLMGLVSKFAGFNLKEADDIRRVVG